MNFKKLVKPYEHTLLKTLNYLVSIDSTYDEKTVTSLTPYGAGVDKCLKEFSKLGNMYGFDVDLNSRYVELSLGESGPLIEIFGHLDVVPVNKTDGIDHFKIIEKDKKLIARGVADDKGPLLASFFAIKALKDNNLIKNVRIKIFAGGDEERGASCLKYYVEKKNKEQPKYGFTPDSDFPIIYGEKGTGNIYLEKNIKLNHILSIEGGEAANIVISKCKFVVDNIDDIKDKLDKNKIESINKNEIIFKGKPAHGSTPELGISAFLEGINELSKVNNDNYLKTLYDYFIDYNGKKLGIYYYSEHLKNTVYNIGIVNYKNNKFNIVVNVRYPENIKGKELAKLLGKKLEFIVKKTDFNEPLLVDPNSDLIKSLLDAYKVETKDKKAVPLTTGGGTYAKDVKNTVAFGAQFHGKNYKMHEDDEFIYKKDLFLAMAIYAHAIYNLINL